MKIRTIESGYQYRVNHILIKFAKENEVEDEFKEDASAAAWKYRKELGQYFVEDIEDWCGMDEAYNEENY